MVSLCFSGCAELDKIDYSPKVSPESFLQNEPWLKIEALGHSFIWTQPSSTFIVYFVGLFTVFVGYSFLKNTRGETSKKWWGIGLVLTGLGALFAGTSYQAFGYEIKCNGREFCTWTSWWEIFYMLLSVPGMNAFLVASAYSNTKASFRKGIIVYAVINTVVYTLLVLTGVLLRLKFLVSFECMVLLSAPSFIFLLILHSQAYYRQHDAMNRTLRNAWLIFLAVGIAYGAYLALGISASLWQQRIWFSENDVLHLGMTVWVFYLHRNLSDAILDLK